MKDIIIHNWMFIVTGIFIALVGIFIEQSKSYSLIAGYNTMSAEKKKKVNIGLVAIAIRNCFIILGLIWVIIPLITELIGFNQVKVFLIIISHLVILILLVIIINTSKKYKISNESANQIK